MSKEITKNCGVDGVSEAPSTRKRPRTEGSNDSNGVPHVQMYIKNKPWSLLQFPWQRIDGRCYKLTLCEHNAVGMGIVPDSPTHFSVMPYGPPGMKCTDRDGCGGVVQRGQFLLWKYNSLLRFESDTVCADVLVVNIDMQEVVDGNIEQLVCRLFHVQSNPNITEPCWLLGTPEANQRDSWENAAIRCQQLVSEMQKSSKLATAEITRIAALQLAAKQHMDKKLAAYEEMVASITKSATCTFCQHVAPHDKPSMLAPCGHHICKGCHEDYYHGIGDYEDPICITCKRVTLKPEWKKFFVLTSVVTALKDAEKKIAELG
jgi:hypothetical protein